MSELEHAQSLLAMAQKDIDALNGMTNTQTFADEIFGFHVQQAVEKLLKAWLNALGSVYPFSHDISVLLILLEEQGCDVEQFWNLVEYNAFAVQFRYQAFEGDEPLDRTSATEKVQILFDNVKNTIENARTI